MTAPSDSMPIGFSVIERQLLEDLATLWRGEFLPTHLLRAERALRAIVTGGTLAVSRYFKAWDAPDFKDAKSGNTFFDMPFEEPELAYEFSLPDDPHHAANLPPAERDFLTKFVSESIAQTASTILPKWVKRQGEAYAFFDAWYEGESLTDCELAARDMRNWEYFDDSKRPYVPEEWAHAMFHKQPWDHAQYLVCCSRAGAVVYGDSPVAAFCSEHLFARWPEQLFSQLDVDYQQVARQLRGPRVMFTLPPLVLLVLSRAPLRHKIPETIRELREEYAPARAALWATLKHMWEAESLNDQIEYLRALEDSSANIFKAAFPTRLDALSLGLTAAGLTPSALVSSGKILLEHNKPRAKVGAIDFSRRLSIDLRSLANSETVLRRHLSREERQAFGLQ